MPIKSIKNTTHLKYEVMRQPYLPPLHFQPKDIRILQVKDSQFWQDIFLEKMNGMKK